MCAKLTVHQMTEAEKQQVCQWRYSGAYAVYDLPSFQEVKAKGFSLSDPACVQNYHAYYAEERLVGYTNLKPHPDGLFLGIGIAPDLCGRGYGTHILNMACHLAAQRYPERPLFLLVRAWNTRAIRCYEKAGFVPSGTPFVPPGVKDDQPFLKMVKKG